MIHREKLNPFGRFCCTIGNLPTSYMLSLSYEEQLIWFCKYLEETVIPAVNNNAEALEELQNLFIELRTYVDEYFDNLDIQTEINNKLDEMAEGGELADIIAQYIELQGILAYDTIDDMKNATNLSNGSFAKTYGYETLNDGEGSYYKVRTILNTDVIDNKNVIALSDETLVAIRMSDSRLKCFDSVDDMVNANNIVNGEYIRTFGYYAPNDEGGALYKVRLRTVGDTTDGATLIALSDVLLVAELVTEGTLNVKQFGAKGDGTTDDTEAIQKAIDLLRTLPRSESKDYSNLYFPDGEYIVSDTLSIETGRWSKITGKATIKANMTKPILRLYQTMYVVIEGLFFIQESTTSGSACLETEESYTNTFNELTLKGGYKGINIISGNQLIFNSCTARNNVYGLYTLSKPNNTENSFNNCTFESTTSYNLYFGFDRPYYGKYNINNCYIEGSTTDALIYVENGMNVTFDKCYINMLTEDGTIIHQTGTVPVMKTKFINNEILATVNNAYLIKQLTDNGITKGCKFDNNLFISITLHNINDTYIPKIGLVNRKKLNIYNLTNLYADSNNNVVDWLGSGTYTLNTSVSEESDHSVDITTQYIYKPFYLKAGVTYDIEAMAKTTSTASIELFNAALDHRYHSFSTNSATWTKISSSFTPTISQVYTMLIRTTSGNTSSYCGINIYSNELDLS